MKTPRATWEPAHAYHPGDVVRAPHCPKGILQRIAALLRRWRRWRGLPVKMDTFVCVATDGE